MIASNSDWVLRSAMCFRFNLSGALSIHHLYAGNPKISQDSVHPVPSHLGHYLPYPNALSQQVLSGTNAWQVPLDLFWVA